jgi:hypothetical protein
VEVEGQLVPGQRKDKTTQQLVDSIKVGGCMGVVCWVGGWDAWTLYAAWVTTCPHPHHALQAQVLYVVLPSSVHRVSPVGPVQQPTWKAVWTTQAALPPTLPIHQTPLLCTCRLLHTTYMTQLRASAIRTVVYGEAPADYGAEQPYGASDAAYAPPGQQQPQPEAYQDPYQQPPPPQQQQQPQQYVPPASPPPMQQQQYQGGYQGQAPASQQQFPPVVAPPSMPAAPGSPKEALWMELFAEPNSWWDNRPRKAAVSGRGHPLCQGLCGW